MAHNRTVLVGRGEVGFPIRTPLIQEDEIPVDLVFNSNWTFDIVVSDPVTGEVLISGDMDLDPDQNTFPNYVTYFLTEDDVWLPAGDYNFQAHATDPVGNVLTFPKDKLHPYGTLTMLPTNLTEPGP